MSLNIIAKFNHLTNNERVASIERWRGGTGSNYDKEVTFSSFYKTINHRAWRQWNRQLTTDEIEERVLMLHDYIIENPDVSITKLFYNYRRLFPTFEMVHELQGIYYDHPITTTVKQNKWYYITQVARLQRNHDVWNVEQLTNIWKETSTPRSRRANAITDYRTNAIREYAGEIIYARWKKHTKHQHQLTPKQLQVSGL